MQLENLEEALQSALQESIMLMWFAANEAEGKKWKKKDKNKKDKEAKK